MLKFLRTAGVALLVVATRSLGAEITEDEGVLVLNPDNFAEAIAQNPTLLVEFYAPWCGHCKKLAPEYAAAAAELAKDDLKIAKVDCDEHKSLASEYGVQGFPTLKLFKEGKPSEYQGGRTKDDIVAYVKKKSGPPAKTIATVEEAKSFEGEGDAVVLGLFAKADSTQATAFMSIAAGIDRLPFATTTSEAVRKEYGATEGDKVVIIKTFDDGKSVLQVTAETGVEDIAAFVNTYSMRLVTVFSPETSSAIFGGAIKVHMLFMSDGKHDSHEVNMETLTKVAEKMRGKMLHVHVPATEDRVLNYFGADADNLPMVVIADMSSDRAVKKYMFEGEIGADALAAFGVKFMAGELNPTLKSAEPSEEDLKEPVKVLTGKSFKSMVLDNDKDVLVEFYAPWCGHCKSLAPKYDALAEKLSGVESVMIAKMDATENEIDVPGIEVQGFPTLFFLPGKSKGTPVQYDGARETDAMASFIMEKASTPFTLDGVKSEGVHEEL